MAIPFPTQAELTERVFSKLKAETGIDVSLNDSYAGALAKITAAELFSLWQWAKERADAASLTTAAGADLDTHGILLGLLRKQSQLATTQGLTRAVRFTNNGVSTVTIPSGTRVYKELDPQVSFFTTEGVTIAAGQSNTAHVVAADTGEIYNVGIGDLNRHSYPNVSVSITNILPITNGSYQESDASYRERLLQGFRQRTVLNRENVIALVRQYQGVKDAFLLDMNRGTGTFDVVVIPWNFSDSSTVVAECNRLLIEHTPAGLSSRAIGPIYRQLDITINLRFAPTIGSRAEELRQSVRAQIKAIVDNLPVEDGSGNGTLYLGRIKAVAASIDPLVLEAMVAIGLDGSPLNQDGQLTLAIGERLIIRGLSIE